MCHDLFDVAKRQFSIRCNNGARARRFALDPSKSNWYSVYRAVRFATRDRPEHAEAAELAALKASESRKHNGDLT